MKNRLIILGVSLVVVLFVSISPAMADSVEISLFSSLTDAVTQINSSDKTLYIGFPTTITADTVVPSNISIVMEYPGRINLQGHSLTINGHFSSGYYQVIAGSGSVVFGQNVVKEVIVDWFGTDVAAAQRAINTAANSGHKDVRFLAKTYSLTDNLYLAYSAASNTTYPSGAREQGRMTIRGSGGVMDTSSVRNSDRQGSCLVFDANKGIVAEGSMASQIKHLRLENINIIGNHAQFLVDYDYVTSGSGFDHVMIYNSNTVGSGLDWTNIWQIHNSNVWIVSSSSSTSGVGLRMRNDGGYAGGHVSFHGTIIGWGTGVELGHAGDGYGNSLDHINLRMDINSAANYAMLIGHGAKSVDASIHAETYGTYGVWIKNNAYNIRIHDGYFYGPDAAADIVVGDNSGTGLAQSAHDTDISNNTFVGTNTTGILFQLNNSASINNQVTGNTFSAKTSGVGAAIDTDSSNADKRGLFIRHNRYPSSGNTFASKIAHHVGGYRMEIIDPEAGVIIPWGANIFQRPIAINLENSKRYMGMFIDNAGATGTVTHYLPDAGTAGLGMEVGFSRTASHTVRIDPVGDQKFRAGGEGAYLSLDSDGALVWIKCYENGVWDIVYSQGTTSYQY